jgi:hypothetical protein
LFTAAAVAPEAGKNSVDGNIGIADVKPPVTSTSSDSAATNNIRAEMGMG